MNNNRITLIQGGIHNDDRGSIRFVNDFNMEMVKRFYNIIHNDISTIRAWQGHQKEQKWFHCAKGEFEVFLIKVNDWDSPSKELKAKSFLLNSDNSQVMHIPGGYVNGFRATQENSSLIVYSDFSIQDSAADDFRFDKNYWPVW